MKKNEIQNNQHSIVLYQNEDSNVCVNVYYRNETFWLTQKAMAELFGVNTQAITKHLGNIYLEQELSKEATCSKMEQVQQEGERQVKRLVDFYNLDAVIAYPIHDSITPSPEQARNVQLCKRIKI